MYQFKCRYRNELHQHGIADLNTPLLPEVDLKLPKLSGKNIEEHFYNIAKQQVKGFQNLIKTFISTDIPEMPKVINKLNLILSFLILVINFRNGHSHLVGPVTTQKKEHFIQFHVLMRKS